MSHKQPKCPNCGRSLTSDELYCYFCEMSLADLMKKHGNAAHRKH